MNAVGAAELLDRAGLARREGRLADAYRDSTEAHLLSQKGGDPDCSIRALRMLGQIRRDEGRPEHALQHYLEAVAVCRTHGGALRLAHAIRHLGDLLVELRRLDEAAIEYETALALYRQESSRTPLDLANTLRAIAVIKQKIGDARAARPFWEEARTLYSAANIEPRVAECELHLGNSNRVL
jgi:tetratricopeptide (TPR) repeat protein